MNAPSTLDVAVRRAGRTDEVTLHLAGLDLTVGDVATALGLPRLAVDVDGRRVDGATAVADAGLRRGSVLSEPDRSGGSWGPVAVARWIDGVDAGASVPLAPGRHVVGRAAAADVFCPDRRAASYSAVVDVGPAGDVVVTPLAVGVAPAGAGRWRMGGARFAVGPPRSTAPVPTGRCQPGEWTVPLARPPRPSAPMRPGAVQAVAASEAAPPRAALLGLVTTLLSLAGGVVAAVLFGQPAFLLLGGTAAVAGVGGWIAQRRHGRRASKTATRRVRADEARFEAEVVQRRDAAAAWLRARAVELPEAVEMATAGDRRLWERRSHHDDVLEVVLGRGRVPWVVPVDGGEPVVVHLDDVPVIVRLERGVVLGVAGPVAVARAVARSLVVQVASTMGPADVAVSVVADDAPDAWAWTAWLPHAVDLDDEAHDRNRVVVVDATDALSSRTSAVRTALAGPATGIVVARSADVLPACCTHVVDVADDATLRVVEVASGAVVDGVLGAGASVATATTAARALGRFDDPELVRPGDGLPPRVGLVDLLGRASLDPAGVATGWSRSDGAVRAPLAVAADGVVEIDLVAHGPHALIAGTTGAGKSELLRSFVAGLAVRCSPADVTFVLIDYKGGSAFDACAGLPHVVGVVTDLDERLAERALRSLHAELRRRERLLRAGGAVDITAYRGVESMPRLVAVVDEFAGLAIELPDFLAALVGVAQRGRSLGIHLVLATQRPAGVVSDDVRANTNLRIALRVQDGADSVDVIGTEDAACLARDRPGQAVVRLAAGELVTVQVATVSAPIDAGDRTAVVVTPMGADPPPGEAGGPTALERLVSVVCAAAHGRPPARRPWLDPLPSTLDLAALPAGAVALADDPDAQAQDPIRWESSGHLLLYGAPGRGTTTALASLAVALACGLSPAERHLYVVDMGAGDLQPLASQPHCGGVVRATERERLVRLVRRLRAEVDLRRGGSGPGRPEVVLLVDGLEALRSRFDEPAGYDVLDALDAVMQEGPDVGIRVIAAVDRPGAVPAALTGSVGDRWVFGLADPAEARSLGVAPARVTGLPPGRAVMASTGLDIQIARPVSVAAAVAAVAEQWPDAAGGPAPIGVLPAVVPATLLPAPAASRRPWSLPIGIADADLQPAPLVLHGGDHVLVTGRARTGRSSALVLLAATIRRAQPEAVVGAVALRPSPVRDVADVVATDVTELDRVSGASVVLVDDAELVTDDGTLAACLARRDGHVAAAVHPDALRSSYGHWAHHVRRSRLGVVLQPDVDIDGELLGTVLPRRQVVPARPGCGYLVVHGRAELVQLAHVA